MYTETEKLWDNTPGTYDEIPQITYYRPEKQKYDGAVIIFPGGAYKMRAEHEGKGYAEFLAEHGIAAFVVDYRVAPHSFPLPLLDARRAVRFVRYYAEKYNVQKDKIAVMGSSAGGHLAALVSTYLQPIDFENLDEIDAEDFLPNRQILCYPVINLYDLNTAHIGSGDNLIGAPQKRTADRILRRKLSPNLLINETTPPAFIWHTFVDNAVNVKNSLDYASALRDYKIETELHIFPHGAHGLGLTKRETELDNHIAQWGQLLVNWIYYLK